MGKNLIRLLAVVLVLVLLGIGIPLIASPDRQGYEYSREQVVNEIVSIADANGSLFSFYDNEIEDFGANGYNVTLPVSYYDRTVDLKDSVSEVNIEYMFHLELTHDHAAMVTVYFGADLVIDAGNTSITGHFPRYFWAASGGFSFAVTGHSRLTLNRTVLDSLNVSHLYIEYEVTFLTEYASSYLVNYAMSILVDLQYRHPVPNALTPLFAALIAVGICSIGVLVIEAEYPLRTEQHPSP